MKKHTQIVFIILTSFPVMFNSFVQSMCLTALDIGCSPFTNGVNPKQEQVINLYNVAMHQLTNANMSVIG